MKAYLESSEMIDWKHNSILQQTEVLAAGNKVETAKACFKFVRDEIRHSWDFQLNPVTCKASDVLKYDQIYLAITLSLTVSKSSLVDGLFCDLSFPPSSFSTIFCFSSLKSSSSLSSFS